VQRERLAPFARHLEGVLDQPVEIVLFREGRGLMMALRRGQMRYAVAPGALVASTQMLCTCIEPLAVQQTITGGTGTFAALAVRADGPVASLEQAAKLDADRVAIVDEGSVVAHRIGLSDLRLDGVGFPEDGAFVFVPSLGRGAAALHAGDVDAVLFWTRQARGDVLTSEVPVHTLDEASRNDLRVVWRSRPALGLTHVVQADLPDEQKDGLQSALVRLIGQNGDAFDAIDGGSGQPFSAISMAELQPYVDAFETWSRQSGQ
ncbi:MAG: PhnD/SsuA/transferrin family substrate-binding protein, partial [Devosiaceae bacterium]|nr:PhnD/SsuA/transferrin family substrate-binding protein [Devosiaceae bacterium MH13]